jgi:hypothetical protein
MVASPGTKAQNSSEDNSSCSTSDSDVEAEFVDMVGDSSPLGNTGTAKALCDMAIASAVEVAFGSETPGAHNAKAKKKKDDANTEVQNRPAEEVEVAPHPIVSLTEDMLALRNESIALRQASTASVDESADAAEDGPHVMSGERMAGPDSPGTNASSIEVGKSGVTKVQDTKNNFASTGLGDTLGNTGAAMALCDDAIAAAVSSAVDAVCLGNTAGSLMEDIDPDCLANTAGGMMTTFGGTKGSMLGQSMKSLGATGDVPPVMPGEGMPGDVSVPATPSKTAHLLKAVLENEEERDPVSPSLMSILQPTSPCPQKRALESSFADSPSLIILEDTHWTICKHFPEHASPPQKQASPPQSLRSSKEELSPPHSPPASKVLVRERSPSSCKKDRPVRCLSPQPLSARGRERHEREMAALGLQSGARSARGSRPRGKGLRHVSVAGGA